MANAPPPALVKTPPTIEPKLVLPKKPHPLVNSLPAVPRHVLLGGQVSLDGGAFSIAPTIALGTNLGQRFFIRGSFWGPTTKTTVQSASAQATVWSLGGRLDAGLAFPVRRGTNLGGSAGLGLARYAIEGKPSLGFTPRAAGQVVFLGGLDVFWLQALTPRFYMELDLGVAVALPSVVIRINRLNAGERGFPEVHARFGFAYAF